MCLLCPVRLVDVWVMSSSCDECGAADVSIVDRSMLSAACASDLVTRDRHLNRITECDVITTDSDNDHSTSWVGEAEC